MNAKLIELFCKEFQLEVSGVDASNLYQQLGKLAASYRAVPPAPRELVLELGQEEKGVILLYSDGACSGNPGKGGWGSVICYPDGKVQELSGGQAMTTNNRMELMGAIQALRAIQQEKSASSQLIIHTDSQYVKNGVTQWVHNWKKNNWKTSSKEPVKNQELWQELDQLNRQLNPQWKWVKGHAGNHWNERCDQLAVDARNQLK
jgi:ribonuclease HI